MKRPIAVVLIVILFLGSSLFLVPGSGHAHIYRFADQAIPSFEQMLDDLVQARVIFIGELHNNAGHHRAQLQVIRGLKKRGVQLAIGMEMFRRDSQEMLDRWVAGELSLPAFAAVFNDNWSSWGQYREILFYGYSERVPLVGLNVSRDITRQVAKKGFASLDEQQLQRLPAVACNVDRTYEKFIRRALKGHVNRDIPFRNFCEAQLLWDKVMAHNIIRFLDANPDYSMVVLAGSGHSWKRGIPAQLQQLTDISYRVLLPEIPGKADRSNLSIADADYLLLGVDQAPLH
jgi:uncharacterized iron-regulated protein